MTLLASDFKLKMLNDGDSFDEVYTLADMCGDSGEGLHYTISTALHSAVVGLFHGDKLVGYGVIEIHNNINPDISLMKFDVKHLNLSNVAILAGAGIHPDYRGDNLQKLLISKRESYATSVGCTSILVTVSENEVASRINLEHSGYKAVASRVTNNGETRYLMHKIME